MNSKKLTIQCKVCGTLLEDSPKPKSCGCPNQTMIYKDKISGNDLSKIIITQKELTEDSKPVRLTKEDYAWQQARRDRKVKRLSYEVR